MLILMVIIFITLSLIQIIAILPELRMAKRIAPAVRITNLSCYGGNADMTAGIELPYGTHVLTPYNFQKAFALDDYVLPRNFKLKVTCKETVRGADELVVGANVEGLRFRGNSVVPGHVVRMANNSGLRIRTTNNKEIALYFEVI